MIEYFYVISIFVPAVVDVVWDREIKPQFRVMQWSSAVSSL